MKNKHFIGAYIDTETHRAFSICAAEEGISRASLLKKLVTAKIAGKKPTKSKRVQPTPCGR